MSAYKINLFNEFNLFESEIIYLLCQNAVMNILENTYETFNSALKNIKKVKNIKLHLEFSEVCSTDRRSDRNY